MSTTESEKWNEAKKEAKELIKNSTWGKNIRFMMALRDELQTILDEYHKNLEKK